MTDLTFWMAALSVTAAAICILLAGIADRRVRTAEAKLIEAHGLIDDLAPCDHICKVPKTEGAMRMTVEVPKLDGGRLAEEVRRVIEMESR